MNVGARPTDAYKDQKQIRNVKKMLDSDMDGSQVSIFNVNPEVNTKDAASHEARDVGSFNRIGYKSFLQNDSDSTNI